MNEKIYFKTIDITFLQKILEMNYWLTSKSWLLDEFILEEGLLTVKTKAGDTIKAPLSEISSEHSLDILVRHEFYLKDKNGEELHFMEMPGMLPDGNWELILSALSPKERKLSSLANKYNPFWMLMRIPRYIIKTLLRLK